MTNDIYMHAQQEKKNEFITSTEIPLPASRLAAVVNHHKPTDSWTEYPHATISET